MKPDMKHIIIDRPRTGGDGGKSIPPKGSKKRLQQTPWDELPKYESTARRRVYGYDCKQLNEHLSPLRRWLQSQVGRDWDEVWSEICEGLSVRNPTTAHVRDHADQYVGKNCQLAEDGTILDSRGEKLGYSWRFKNFYVDPRNNTLQIVPERKYRYGYRRKKEWIAGKDEDHRYYMLNGVWYEVEFKPFPGVPKKRPIWYPGQPPYVNYCRVYDVVIAATWENKKHKYGSSTEQDCKTKYHKDIYAASKRQLNKREIRKLKLWETKIGKEFREAA